MNKLLVGFFGWTRFFCFIIMVVGGALILVGKIHNPFSQEQIAGIVTILFAFQFLKYHRTMMKGLGEGEE